MSRRATLFVPALGYRKPLPENLAASKPQPVDEEWKADLVIMDSLSKEKNGYKYILTVIDVLSKYAWAEPQKTKSGEDLIKAFQKICRKGRQPEKLHTDKDILRTGIADFYRIEKVIKSRIRGKRREYLVKWLGYSNDFNSWVPEDNVKDISK